MTVAIPTMNGARHLAEALSSVLAQGDAAAEIIVSDDRSDDDTLRVVRDVAGDRVRVSVNGERLGLAGNWNRCVDLCRTGLIAIVHQDDRLLPGHAAAHLAAYRLGTPEAQVGIVAGAAGVIDEDGRQVPESVVGRGGLGMSDRVFSPVKAVASMAEVNPLRCSAVSMRVEAHVMAGGFRPCLRYAVDWHFWLEIARKWSVAWLSTPSVDVRWHSSSETHRFATGTADLEETEGVLQDNLDWLRTRSVSTTRIERSARRRLARAYLSRANVVLRAGDGTLARSCLGRSLALWPGVLGAIAADPRLAALMAAASLAPRSAGRWLKRSES